jgi:hypothetical protein
VHDAHQRLGHRGGIGVLDDVAPVDDPRRALVEDRVRALEDLPVGHPAAAPDEQRHARDGDDAVVVGGVVARVGLDHVGAQLGRLAHHAADTLNVAVDAVGAAGRLEHERLDHQRHRRAVAFGAQADDVGDRVLVQLGVARRREQVDDDARGVEPDGLADRVVDQPAPRLRGRLRGVDVRDVAAQDQRGLVAARPALEEVGLADRELDGVGRGIDQRVDRALHVLDAGEHARLAGDAVVDGHVEAPVRVRVEEAVQAVLLHGVLVGVDLAGARPQRCGADGARRGTETLGCG